MRHSPAHDSSAKHLPMARFARPLLPLHGECLTVPIKKRIRVTVNGVRHERSVEPRLLLSDFLRHGLNLTGTHVGCEHGICGACTVLVDGNSARACLTLAVQADNAEIRTIEGHGSAQSMSALQKAFKRCHGLQCGFCTPGFLATIEDMLNKYPLESEGRIRELLSGNLCRCTGYQNIVDAVLMARDERAQAEPVNRQAEKE